MSNLRMDPTRSITARKQLQVRLTAPIKKMKKDVAVALRGNPTPTDLRVWFDSYTNRTTPQSLETIRKEVTAAYDRGARAGMSKVSSSSGNRRTYSPIMDRDKDMLNFLVQKAQDDYLNVLSETKTQVVRAYTTGVMQEQPMKDLIKAVKNRFDKIGITRSRTLANTEIVRSHSEGMLDLLSKLDIEEFTIEAEWVTATNPCPLCQARSGIILPLAKMRGLIPLHPNCLCSPKPVIKNRNRTRITRGLQSRIA